MASVGDIIFRMQERLDAQARAINILPFPTCAVCGHRVEEMELEHHAERMRSKVTVRCHGATESMWIPHEMMVGIGKHGFQAGRAFEPPAGLLEG